MWFQNKRAREKLLIPDRGSAGGTSTTAATATTSASEDSSAVTTDSGIVSTSQTAGAAELVSPSDSKSAVAQGNAASVSADQVKSNAAMES